MKVCRWCAGSVLDRNDIDGEVELYDCTSTGCLLARANANPVGDAPGMLRVKLRDHQKVSGSGNDYAVVLAVADRAERAAFARTALAVKLRELDFVCSERDRLDALAHRLTRECRDIAIQCERHDSDLEWAIEGKPIKRER